MNQARAFSKQRITVVMLCVPVPGTINAVAASVMAAVIAEAAPRATAPRNARTATSIARRFLPIRQISHGRAPFGRGSANFLEVAVRLHDKTPVGLGQRRSSDR